MEKKKILDLEAAHLKDLSAKHFEAADLKKTAEKAEKQAKSLEHKEVIAIKLFKESSDIDQELIKRDKYLRAHPIKNTTNATNTSLVANATKNVNTTKGAANSTLWQTQVKVAVKTNKTGPKNSTGAVKKAPQQKPPKAHAKLQVDSTKDIVI